MTASRTRILVADDQVSVRAALLELLFDDGGFEVVAAVGDADAAVAAARDEQPDVAVLDVKMPGSGVAAAGGIRAVSPGTRMVAFSAHQDRLSIVEMLRAGVVGYLVKGASNDEILAGLRRAAEGLIILPHQVAAQFMGEFTAHLEQNHRASRQRREREQRIREILISRRVELAFQPIFDFGARTVAGYEAFARFPQEPRRGPAAWFAEARSVGLQLDLELLAARVALAAQPRLPDGTFLAVNASPSTAANDAFHAAVLGATPQRTVVEITERTRVFDQDRLNRELEPLRSVGVRVALDDAGAGFASLRHLVQLAPDMIKLDVALTREVHTDRARRALARAIVSFAAETDASIVAEGIELDAQLRTLHDLGVGYGQGNLLASPAVLDELLAAGPSMPQVPGG